MFDVTNRKCLTVCLIAAIVIIVCLTIGTAFAASTVRVGYYESDNFQEGMTDDSVKRGYAYDYLQTIANYTGWKYEYVYGDAGALYEMLREGSIDIMAGISSVQGADNFLYPDLPMGEETYTLYGRSDTAVTLADGVRIASVANSARTEQLKQWAKKKGIEPDIREYETRAVMDAAFEAGWADVAVEADTDMTVGTSYKPIERVGSADFYLCIAKGREDLLAQLNKAQKELNEAQPDYIAQLETRYYGQSAVKALLTDEEKSYIYEHRQLKIGYITDYMPFSGVNESGMRTGLIDEIISEILNKLSIEQFVTPVYTSYSNADAMLADLQAGKLDLIFPLQKSNWHADQNGISETETAVSASMVMVYAYNSDASSVGQLVIEQKDPVSATYAELYYPGAEITAAADVKSALEAVRRGEASAALLNSVRASQYIGQAGNSVYRTAVLMDAAEMCFGVRRNDISLLTLMNRGIALLESTRLQEKMLRYSGDTSVDFYTFLRQHMLACIMIAAAVLLIVFTVFFVNYRKVKIKNRELNRANFARIAAEEETTRLLHSLEYDELTQFYTRAAFYEYAPKYMGRQPNGKYDLWMTDIDNFKSVNDIHGSKAGDEVLTYIADRLSAFRAQALYGRYGADRFCILMPHEEETDFKLLEAFVKDVERNAPVRGVALKLGVYREVDRSLPIQRICDRAMIAIRSIKQNFGRCVAEFDDPQIADMQRNSQMEADFENALGSGEFEVWYQPKFDPVTEKPVASEALVRWRRDGKMVTPGIFIPLFETDGLIARLDEYVFRKTCSDMRRHLDMGRRPLTVSVNLSRTTLHTPNVAEKYAAILKEYGIDVKMIAIELTESAAVGDNGIRALTASLIREGFALHMDDFGSGYSSLASLNVLPFTTVKLDKTLIDCIGEGGGNELLRHVIEMCHFKGMPVVAEGVECKAQMEFLRNLNCDMIQGYYYSRPIENDDYTAMLEKTE